MDAHEKSLVSESENVEGGGVEAKSVIEELLGTMFGSSRGAELQSVPLFSWSFFSTLATTMKGGKVYKNLLAQLTVKALTKAAEGSGFQDT